MCVCVQGGDRKERKYEEKINEIEKFCLSHWKDGGGSESVQGGRIDANW